MKMLLPLSGAMLIYCLAAQPRQARSGYSDDGQLQKEKE
jgi:hypothetical protein